MPQAARVSCADQEDKLPGSVLFVCTMNAVRSVMAAAIMAHLCGRGLRVESAGVNAGVNDNVVEEVMDEIGISVAHHRSKSLDDLQGQKFELIVSLSPEAHHRVLDFSHDTGSVVEYWPTMDATVAGGRDGELIDGYRGVRDQLFARIKSRFGIHGGPSV